MDLFVNDAFGSAHRAHASTEGVARLLPAYAGLLLEQELEMLGRLLGEVERPFVLVAGGAKVEDKLGVLVNLGRRADVVLIGGKMAEELRTGSLPYEARLPVDVVAAAAFEADAESRVVPYGGLPEGWFGLDIGRKRARASPRRSVARGPSSGTAPWACSSGRGSPRGRTRWHERRRRGCIHGRRRRRLGIAVQELRLADRVSWISTGGGASLEPRRQGASRGGCHP